MITRLKHLSVFYKDSDKKKRLTILKECLVFGLIKKSLPTDYFRKFLYRKDIKNYKDYLSMQEYYSIIESPKMVYPEISHLLTNKLSFKLMAAKYKLKVQDLLSYNVKNHFFFNAKHQIVDTQEQLIHFFKNQFETSGINSIF